MSWFFFTQVRFLVEQGIDHLVSLSPEKIPPHYAFPNLKHTLIPVEDFTGPTIAEIQKFIEITDEARREGEAVGVHCAEGQSVVFIYVCDCACVHSVMLCEYRPISRIFFSPLSKEMREIPF